jgi:HPt (histidine-containing phosphotransfer) domain-containing protein
MNEMERKQYIDLESALGRVRGNKKLYRRMLGLFTQSKEFAALEDSLAAGDLNAAAGYAHSIKGMTGNLTLTKLFETSTALMNELRQGQMVAESIAAYRDALEKTKTAVDEVMAEMDA